MTSDSDDDYCNVGVYDSNSDDVESESNGKTSEKNKSNVRGKDIVWYEFLHFSETKEYLENGPHTKKSPRRWPMKLSMLILKTTIASFQGGVKPISAHNLFM